MAKKHGGVWSILWPSSLRSDLLSEMASLQSLIAVGISQELQYHDGTRRVLLKVSLSSKNGGIYNTLQAEKRSLSSGRSAPSRFGNGMELDTHIKRIVAISQLAGYVFAQLEEDGDTVCVAFQIEPELSGKNMDGSVQAFVKDGLLVIKEIRATDFSEAMAKAPLPLDERDKALLKEKHPLDCPAEAA